MQVAIVTGASSGIGFGCATKLAEHGDGGSRRRPGRGAGSPNWRRRSAIPDRVATLAVDLTADDAPRRIVDAAVAAVGPHRLPDQQRRRRQPEAAARDRRRITGLLPGLDAARTVPLARDVIAAHAPGSAIINVTSTFAVVGGLRGGAYSAAKGGLTALTTHIACQYGPQGIRCNAVAPGVTLTPMVEHRLEDERFRKINTEMTPHHAAGHGRRHREHRRVPVLGRAAVSSTVRRSSSTAAGVRRSTCRTSR